MANNDTTGIMALRGDWLSSTNEIQTATNCQMTVGAYTVYPTVHYQYPWWTERVYVSSPARPIKLTLKEVESLRRAAKADPKLKAVLEKFTPQIEVQMDFE